MRAMLVQISLLALLVGLNPVYAQELERDKKPTVIIPLTQDMDKEIAVARRLIRARNYQGAADLLELAFHKDPDNSVIHNLLRSCYTLQKQYEKSVLLSRRLIEAASDPFSEYLHLAFALTRVGNTDEAAAVYDTAAGFATDRSRLSSLIRSMISSRMDDKALVQIERARKTEADPRLYALERGRILEGQQKYEEAFEEYVDLLLADTAATTPRAEKQVLHLLSFEESARIVEDALLAIADSTSSVSVIRLLSNHYIKAGSFEKAFTFALKQDSLGDHQAVPLLDLMLNCEERELWNEVVGIAEYVLTHYGENPSIRVNTSFQYANALARLGRGEEAIAAYEELHNSCKRDRCQADALFGGAVVYFDLLEDYETALIYFDSIVNRYPQGLTYLNARKAIPHCHLRAGKLTEAREELTELERFDFGEDVEEEIAYYLGLIDFFENEYDSASLAFRKLMLDYPRGFYFNDALQLVLLITEGAEAESSLNKLACALFFEQRRMYDSTRTNLISLVERESAPLGDIALYRLGNMEMGLADSSAAMKAYERLIDGYPESYYTPYGMKICADMLVVTTDGVEESRQIYRTLLEAYPDYPFAAEVREKLRELETTQPIG